MVKKKTIMSGEGFRRESTKKLNTLKESEKQSVVQSSRSKGGEKSRLYSFQQNDQQLMSNKLKNGNNATP